MIIKECIWHEETFAFYFFPLIGYSNVSGEKSMWFGWLLWLFTVKFENKGNVK